MGTQAFMDEDVTASSCPLRQAAISGVRPACMSGSVRVRGGCGSEWGSKGEEIEWSAGMRGCHR